MFCSTIIPTIGRLSLSRTVTSILQQSLPDGGSFEVIVVNDSGAPLPPADWQQSPQVRLIHTNRRERSMARNTGAAAANGRFLHFIDDDDWLEPGALQHFWHLAQHSDAAWLYGSSQLVDRQARPLIQLHHQISGNCFLQAMAGEWIPLQASFIKSEVFFASGGFNPLLSGPEDIDLLRRIALRHELAGTGNVVANIVRGEVGSATDYDRHPEQSRWAREQILDESGAFARMRQSSCLQTGDVPAWRGRVARIYFTSTIWNLQRRRFWIALSRAAWGLVAFVQTGPHLFSGVFWRAFSRPYASDTFARGEAAARLASSSRQAV
ncbi:MAG: glycosyltransferase family 2 protein [Anaerolinea sp.]|nr:glycosyltransferase family 2 protein [Anaerolinea sp.]